MCQRRELDDLSESEIEIVDIPFMLMTQSERVLLYRYMASSSRYFEYGSGGSTVLACRTDTIEHITSIDSDRDLLQTLVNTTPCLNDAIKIGRIAPLYANIGEIGSFGFPEDGSVISESSLYPERIVHTTPRPDMILVDGRFRVASALYSLLVSSVETVIAIHDFFSRPQYYPVLNYADIYDCVNDLVVIKRKQFFNVSDMLSSIQEHMKILD